MRTFTLERRRTARRALIVAAVLAAAALAVWVADFGREETLEQQAASATLAPSFPAQPPQGAAVVIVPDVASLPYRVDRLEKDIAKLQEEDKSLHQEINTLRDAAAEHYNRLSWLLIVNLAAVITALGSSLLRRVRRVDGVKLGTSGEE